MAEAARVQEEKKSWIPPISDERLQELFKRIKPVVRMERVSSTSEKHEDESVSITTKPDPNGEWSPWDNGEQYYIEDVDLRGIAYTWEPKPTEKATGLKPLCDITTYHTYGYHGFFKPSIAEVLAQIPDEHVDKVVAFEIVDSPEDVNDLNREHEALNAGYHVATTRLYVQG